MNPTQLFVFVDCDTQRDLAAPPAAPLPDGVDQALPVIRRLIDFAAQSGIPVISTACTFADGDKSPGICLAGTPGAEKVDGTVLPGAFCITSERGAPVPRPLPSQVILKKPEFDPLSNPNAMGVIEQVYGRTAVLFGLTLERGVREALWALRRFGLPCRVVRDAVAIDSLESAAKAEREIMEVGARIVASETILAHIAQRLASPAS